MSTTPPSLDVLLSQLMPWLQDLFHRHCVEGETLPQIGLTTAHSTHSMQRAVRLLRHQLISHLIESGLSEKEAMDYLYQVLTAHP